MVPLVLVSVVLVPPVWDFLVWVCPVTTRLGAPGLGTPELFLLLWYMQRLFPTTTTAMLILSKMLSTQLLATWSAT